MSLSDFIMSLKRNAGVCLPGLDVCEAMRRAWMGGEGNRPLKGTSLAPCSK